MLCEKPTTKEEVKTDNFNTIFFGIIAVCLSLINLL